MILAAIAALTFSVQAEEIATISIGDWDNASTYNGSYFDMAPTSFYLAHTGSQMIFTPDLLSDLDGKQNVKITGLILRPIGRRIPRIRPPVNRPFGKKSHVNLRSVPPKSRNPNFLPCPLPFPWMMNLRRPKRRRSRTPKPRFPHSLSVD